MVGVTSSERSSSANDLPPFGAFGTLTRPAADASPIRGSSPWQLENLPAEDGRVPATATIPSSSITSRSYRECRAGCAALPILGRCFLDSQIVEMLGRNRLIDELLRAGLEVAVPMRDRGIDLIAYVDLESKTRSFVARPIQMKAASKRSFGLDKKYRKFPGLLLAFVWNLESEREQQTFALTYGEALDVADRMGWTGTESWGRGRYSNTRPGKRLRGLLERYRMSSERWWSRIVEVA